VTRTVIGLAPVLPFTSAILALSTLAHAGHHPTYTKAYDAQFYAERTIATVLVGDAARDALSEVLSDIGGRGVEVRVLGVPSACDPRMTAQWQRQVGEVRRWVLDEVKGARGHFLQAIENVDFGGIDIVDDGLQGAWYECPRPTSFSLLTDETRTHFVLREGDRPFLAWSRF
jgi:hypothetical protein